MCGHTYFYEVAKERMTAVCSSVLVLQTCVDLTELCTIQSQDVLFGNEIGKINATEMLHLIKNTNLFSYLRTAKTVYGSYQWL